MATAFVDRCIFTPASGGTGNFVVASAVAGYQTPASANAVDGATYGYAAQSIDLSQWEVGEGPYIVSTTTLARTTVLFNSLGTTAKVNFTVAPQVLLCPVAEQLNFRTILTSNINFYISTTGSDSNDGSAAHPWATLQHAFNYIAANLDIGGFIVFVNVDVGSYVGASFQSTVGGGIIQVRGSGSSLTTIGNGPNDGVINFGECFGANVQLGTVVAINGVAFSDSGGFGCVEIFATGATMWLGDIATTGATPTDISFTTSANSAQFISVLSQCFLGALPGNIEIIQTGVTAFAAWLIEYGVFNVNNVTVTLSGTDNSYSASLGAFCYAVYGGKYIEETSSYVGTATGTRFGAQVGAQIAGSSAPGQLGPNHFPGNAPGFVDATSGYDYYQYAQPTAAGGAPTTSDLVTDKAFGVFEDNSGNIYASVNVSGTIKDISGSVGANPNATAGPTAVNGSAVTFMRSDAAPAVQKATSSQFGLVQPDNSTVIINGSGFLQAVSASPTLNTQVRVTFTASSDQPLATDHCSIGIQSTNYNTTATPVELTFGGGNHGFSILAGASITSDWVDFSFTSYIGDVYATTLKGTTDDGNQGYSFRQAIICNGGVTVIVILDLSSGGPYGLQKSGFYGESWYNNSASYNQANPSGTWTEYPVRESTALIATQ